MDKKTFTIGILSLSAVVLTAANLIQPKFAEAAFVQKDNDYTVVTARIADGGDALYVLDNRTGQVAALRYDPARRTVVPAATAVKQITEAFAAGAGPAQPVRPRR